MVEAGLLVFGGCVAILAAAAPRSQQRERVAFDLSFPRTVEPSEAVAAFRSIGGLLPPLWRRLLSGTPVVVLETHADASGVAHRLIVESTRAAQVTSQLAAAIPGLRFTAGDASPPFQASLARELRKIGPGLLRTDSTQATTSSVLASLYPLRRGEQIVVQYLVAPVGAARWLDRRPPEAPRSSEPELALTLRVGVIADVPQREPLMARVLGSFHAVGSAEARLARRLTPSANVARSLARLDAGRGSRVAADEIAALSPIPVAGPLLPGLTLAGARPLPPVAAVPRHGLVLGDAAGSHGSRPVAIAHAELRRGLHICAPTGAGKSTVLLNVATQLMAAGQALVVIDSKGDLAAEIADRIPAGRIKDTLLFDPASEKALGFNLLGGAADADLIVEHVVGQFRARYGAAGLGPRSEDILRSALSTLTRRPGMTLTEVEPLLTNPAFRRRLTAEIDEPVLEAFWGWFGSLSEPARAEAVAPLLNKWRTYTLSRRVRTVIGQAGGLDLGRVLRERGILLVSLARGVIGEDSAGLLGAAMVSRLWHVIQGRASIPAAKRVPATVICDEFQDFAALPLAFETALAQSRGYGVSWTLAHQNLAQLPTRLRQAVLANCRSRLVMQTTASDAAVFAKEFAPFLRPSDLQGLGAWEGYAAISAGAAVSPPASLRTRPAPEPTGSLEVVRSRSRERGMSSADVDAAIRARLAAHRSSAPIGGRRRG